MIFLVCPYGYRQDRNGCDLCQCRRCSSSDCFIKKQNGNSVLMKCPFGFQGEICPFFDEYFYMFDNLENDSGCRICRCRDPHEQSIGPRPKSRDCIWNNSRKKEGEMWLAECHLCFCYSGNGFEHGTVMCSLLKCPNLKENGDIKLSDILKLITLSP